MWPQWSRREKSEMKQVLLLIVSGLLLVACSSAPSPDLTAEATTTATLTMQPTEISTPTPPATPAPTQTATPTEMPEPTSTPTAMPTPTATCIPTFTLSGVVFFDYNGNGVHDEHELPIPGATVQVGSLVTTAASDGTYSIENVPAGRQTGRVSAEGFRYISLSLEAFQPSDWPVSLTIGGNTRQDWGFMQGFLTLPFGPDAVFEERYRNSPFGMATVFDLDPRPGSAIAYRADILPAGPAEYPPWVVDGHYGIDFCISEGTPVLATMPGIVTYVGVDHLGGKGLWICSTLPTGINYAQYYNHNKEILVRAGDYVCRGQAIAISGNTGTQEFHLHFETTTCETPPRAFMGDMALDPFATINPDAPTQSPGYWTVRNSPQYP